MDKSPSASATATPRARWLRSIGPGLVTACVVIGPGSILTSSKVGASDGYSKIWVVVLAVLFMMTYTALAAKLGAVTGRSTGELVSDNAGRWLAVLIGLGVFFISAAFQFGNNLGVHAALSTYVEFDYWIVLFNGVSIAFVFAFRNLYRVVERLMACFVGVMLISFALNLWFARPDFREIAAGLVPFGGSAQIGLPLLGLVGTTFVISAAYYQSYLVRFKGWTENDVAAGLTDARVGSVVMMLITLMIMSTAAAVLRGKDLGDVGDVAGQLYPLFGEKGRAIFCVGLFSAAFSSFVVNSMIGGFILSDALKLGSTPDRHGPRVLTAAVLLIGMVIALYVIKTGAKPVSAIVTAQAVTVIAAPLMAVALLWLTNLRSVMGAHRNGPWMNLAAGTGLALLVLMAWYTAVEKVWPAMWAVSAAP
jgi:manganese transport protein